MSFRPQIDRFFFAVVLCLLAVAVFSVKLCRAASIAPDLQSVIQSAAPGKDVPVIINLSENANTDYMREKDKHLRRARIVKALKEKAESTQQPLRFFLRLRGAKKITPLWIRNAVAATVSPSVITELLSFPGIDSIQLDAVIKAPPVIQAAEATPEWNILRINAPGLWSVGITGKGVVVANLDTGVDVTHSDLHAAWRGGDCFATIPPDCPSWFDPYTNSTQPYDPVNPGTAASAGHGTGTMGIMVGGSTGGTAIGVAPDAKWIAAKIFDDASGGSNESAIHEAFQWVLAPGGDIANAPDIVNNSWGNNNAPGVCDITFQSDIQTLEAAGIAVVFAGGNTGPLPSTSVSPANLVGSFAVGSVDAADTIANKSSRGPSPSFVPPPPSTDAGCDGGLFPHLVAPGENIKVAFPGDSYMTYSGTSFSAPHVTGAMALLLSAFPSLTPDQLRTSLTETALGLIDVAPNDVIPNNIYGYGRIDAAAAYRNTFNSIKGNVPQTAGVPSAVYFINVAQGTTSDAITIAIVNQGTAPLTISGVSIAGDFAVTNDGCSSPLNPPISSLSSCTITITFSPGAAGTSIGQLSVSSDDPSAPVFNVPLRGNDPVAQVHDSSVIATYPDIQTAIDNCNNWDIVRMQSGPFTESPVFSLPLGIAVSLQGGYDAAFGTQSGFTTIQGELTIGKGTVTLGNLIIQ